MTGRVLKTGLGLVALAPFATAAAVAFAAACTPAPPLSQVPPAPTGSNQATRGDALCGEKYRWDGVRCVQTEAAPVERRVARSGAPEGGAKGAGGGDEYEAPKPSSPGNGPQLVITDLKVGTGTEARAGDTVRLHYVGTLADGTEFDSSRKRGQPFEFRVGAGQVIKGFDRGVIGMKTGGVRKVHIPYELGYGRKGSPPQIPPRADLDFELELLEVGNGT